MTIINWIITKIRYLNNKSFSDYQEELKQGPYMWG